MNLLEDISVMSSKSAVSKPDNAEINADSAEGLVALAQDGEMDAIGALYDQHQASVFRYVWSSVSDRQLAEDLTGEVFTRMLAALPHYRSGARPFRAWLFRIARNLVIDHYRKSGKDRASSLEEVAEIPQGEKHEPASAYERGLIVERLHTALSELDTLQREVLVLRFLNGLTIKETAQVLDKTEAAIKALQHRGLASLRFSLTEESR